MNTALVRKGDRTLDVGKAKNGKLVRSYAKGKQLGDANVRWMRVEVLLQRGAA